jgi:hypothetical protein
MAPKKTGEVWLSVAAAAERKRVGKATIHNWITAGLLKTAMRRDEAAPHILHVRACDVDEVERLPQGKHRPDPRKK